MTNLHVIAVVFIAFVLVLLVVLVLILQFGLKTRFKRFVRQLSGGKSQVSDVEAYADSLPSNFHRFIQQVVDRFHSQRTEQDQFAVMFLMPSKDTDSFKFTNKIGPQVLTNSKKAVWPPDEQIINYIVARVDRETCPGTSIHSEESLIKRTAKLFESYQNAFHSQPSFLVLFSWLMPCKHCTSQFIHAVYVTNADLFESTKVIIAYVLDWCKDAAAEDSRKELKRKGVVVVQVNYDRRLPRYVQEQVDHRQNYQNTPQHSPYSVPTHWIGQPQHILYTPRAPSPVDFSSQYSNLPMAYRQSPRQPVTQLANCSTSSTPYFAAPIVPQSGGITALQPNQFRQYQGAQIHLPGPATRQTSGSPLQQQNYPVQQPPQLFSDEPLVPYGQMLSQQDLKRHEGPTQTQEAATQTVHDKSVRVNETVSVAQRSLSGQSHSSIRRRLLAQRSVSSPTN